ncbi:MAG TPA: TadG family pilus assembly protein [Moraxellaceae bacterium]|nr:TadG family pilus assembly protein [Moraxellaceae bacterium]
MPCTFPKRPLAAGPRRQRGAVAIMVAFFLIMVMGFLALAVDSFHLFVVRNELQNDADAAALAGAGSLFASNESAEPDFTTAESKARSAIPINPSLNAVLADGDVTGGYWNSTDGFQPNPMTPGAGDYAALRVKVTRSAGSNGGPVELFVAGLVGVASAPTGATAVAAVFPPGVSNPGGLFPVALTNCLFEHFWNYTSNNPEVDPVTGEPYIFKIGTPYQYEGCDTGQWTSFLLDKNDTTTIRDLIANGNPDAIALNDETWLEPGVKAALYNTVHDCSAAGDRSCEYVTMPVIETDDVSVHAQTPVKAFACVRILDAVGGSEKYVLVQMTVGCHIDGTGGGPYYGTTLPPKLVQ